MVYVLESRLHGTINLKLQLHFVLCRVGVELLMRTKRIIDSEAISHLILSSPCAWSYDMGLLLEEKRQPNDTDPLIKTRSGVSISSTPIHPHFGNRVDIALYPVE